MPGQQGVEVGDRRCGSQRDVAATQETHELAHPVESRAALALDGLEEDPGALRVEVLAGLGGGRQLAEPLLQKAVELAGETDPVAGELQRDPLVTHLPELCRARPQLGTHSRTVSHGATDGEDDQHDRQREHDQSEAGGGVHHQHGCREHRGEA